MLDFIIISDHPELYSSKRLVEEISQIQASASFLDPYNYGIELTHLKTEEKKSGIVFHRTTGIRFADFDLSVSLSLETKGKMIANSLESFNQLRGKERQALFFAKHNIPFIPTYSFRGRPEKKRLEQITHFFKNLGFHDEAYILKTIRGNQGIGVNIIRGNDSLASLLETFWAIQDQSFIIQPFVNIEEELRIFSISGKIEGALSRKPGKGEFRSNSARGQAESVAPLSLPRSLHELIYKLYEKSKALYAGIDLLKKDGQYIIIEYNLVPGFDQMEHLTGTNIAKKIVHATSQLVK